MKPLFVRLGLHSQEYTKGMRDARKQLTEMNKNTKSLTAGLRSLKNIAIASFAGWGIKEVIKNIALLGARYETLGVVLTQVGKNVYLNKKQLKEYTDALEKTGISMIQARNNVIRMIQANLDLTKSQKLARIAQDAAVIGNINSSESFERLIYGIQTAQIRVLRTIGINVNFERSYAKLAKQLGITQEALTEDVKAQARMNVVLEAGERITGAYEASLKTAGKQLLSWERYLENTKVLLGEAFGPAMTLLVKELTKETKNLGEVFKDPEFKKSIIEISKAMASFTIDIKEFIKAILYLPKAVNEGLHYFGFGIQDMAKDWNDATEAWNNFINSLSGELPRLKGKQVPDDLYGFDVSKVDEALEDEFRQIDEFQNNLYESYIKNIEKLDKEHRKLIRNIDRDLKEFFKDSIYNIDKESERLSKIAFTAAKSLKNIQIDEDLKNFFEILDRNEGMITIRIDTELEKFFNDLDNHTNFENIIDLELEDFFKDIDRATHELDEIIKETASSMRDSFSDLFFDAMVGDFKSFGDYLNDFFRSISRMISNYMAESLVTWGMDYFGFGNLSGRQHGGPVYPNKSYLVGERGPEIIKMGNSSGYVYPNSSISEGTEVNVSINNYTDSSVKVQKGTNPRDIFITIANDVNGGIIGRAIEKRFGLLPQTRKV